MRSWMNAGRSYVPPVEIGEVMRAAGIGRVIDSRHPDFDVGEELYGVFGVQRYAVSDGTGVRRVDTTLAPAPVYLGVARDQRPDRVLRAARRRQARARPDRGGVGRRRVGRQHRRPDRADQGLPGDGDRRAGRRSAGGWSRSSGSTPRSTTRGRTFARSCASTRPTASTSSSTTSAARCSSTVLSRLARGARVVISGAVSQYNATEAFRGPANYMQLLVARASMTGFVIFDYAERFERGRRSARQVAARAGSFAPARTSFGATSASFPRCSSGSSTGRTRGSSSSPWSTGDRTLERRLS